MSRTLAFGLVRVRQIAKEPIHTINTSAYSTGTVSVTNGSVTVTGSGTAWLTTAKAGQTFHIAAGRYYHILSINSDTSITLVEAYAGTTASGAAYTITGGATTNGSVIDNLNEAQRECVSELNQFDENHFTVTGTISYVSGTETYALPTTNGVVKTIINVTRTDLTSKKQLHPIPYQAKFKYYAPSGISNVDNTDEKYYINGSNIGIIPVPTVSATNNITIDYVPVLADMTVDASTFTVYDDYIDWVCYIAAAKMTTDQGVIAERERLKSVALRTIGQRQVQESRSVINNDEDCYY